MLAQVRDALDRGRRLHLSYYVPGRDEATERDVDPMRLLVVEGRTYLEGWCLRAEAVRLFRLDRVLGTWPCSTRPRRVPARRRPRDVDQGLFRPSADDVEVELELSAAGRWVAEYYPCERVERTRRRQAAGGAAHPGYPVGPAAGAAARARTAG